MTPPKLYRIVHVIQSMDQSAGGPPVVCARLASTQSQRGHRVSIVTHAAGNPPPLDHAVEIRVVPVLGTMAAYLHPPASIEQCVEGADVLHFHGVWDPLLIALGRVAFRNHVPYLVAPHGMLDPWSLQQKRLKKQLALVLGVRRFLDRAAALHLLNRDEIELIRPLGLRSPTALIPNGISFEEIDPLPPESEFRESFPSLGDAPFILFLSRLHYKKGLDYLADAFALLAPKHPECKLVVAGADGGERSNFERRIRDHQLSDRTLIVGPLYGRAKWGAISACTLFCLPSRQEGFSIAILEAMAARKPVVISENCHFPEVAESKAGIIAPLVNSAFALGIESILNNLILAKEMGNAGRKLVESRYTWDRVVDLCDQTYATAKSRVKGP